jgi:hypothetical protein
MWIGLAQGAELRGEDASAAGSSAKAGQQSTWPSCPQKNRRGSRGAQGLRNSDGPPSATRRAPRQALRPVASGGGKVDIKKVREEEANLPAGARMPRGAIFLLAAFLLAALSPTAGRPRVH